MTDRSITWSRQPEGSKASFTFSHTIADYIDKKSSSCEVDIAPFAVFLNEDDRNYVEPDISVICDTNKLTDRGCSGAPDWIIEIVSPGSKQHGLFFKLFKYQATGVREYWIVDPTKNVILSTILMPVILACTRFTI